MKKGTKVLALSFLGLLLILVIAGVVSAQNTNTANQAGQQLQGVFKEIAGFFQGLFGLSSDITLQKFFLGFLLVLVIYSLVKDFFNQSETICWIASIVIGLLAFGTIGNELVSAILLQYTAMGATIVTIIPIAIMIMFTLSTSSLLVARISWLFYIIYYFFTYFSALTSAQSTAVKGFYWAAILLGIIGFFFIRTMRGFLSTEKLKGEREAYQTEIKKSRAFTKTTAEGLDTGAV